MQLEQCWLNKSRFSDTTSKRSQQFTKAGHLLWRHYKDSLLRCRIFRLLSPANQPLYQSAHRMFLYYHPSKSHACLLCSHMMVRPEPAVHSFRSVPCLWNLQPSPFPSESSWVAHVITLLTGRAQKWGTAVWDTKTVVWVTRNFLRRCRRFLIDHLKASRLWDD